MVSKLQAELESREGPAGQRAGRRQCAGVRSSMTGLASSDGGAAPTAWWQWAKACKTLKGWWCVKLRIPLLAIRCAIFTPAHKLFELGQRALEKWREHSKFAIFHLGGYIKLLILQQLNLWRNLMCYFCSCSQTIGLQAWTKNSREMDGSLNKIACCSISSFHIGRAQYRKYVSELPFFLTNQGLWPLATI